MSRRQQTRSRTTTSEDAAARPTPVRPHVVDRALAVYRLLAEVRSSVEVQRRLRVSKSTVSVLGYLGAALAGMESESVAELRTPAVTTRDVWRLATDARTAERAAQKRASSGDERDQARRRAIVALRASLRDHASAARVFGASVGAASGRARGGGRAADRRVAGRSAAARAVGWSYDAWASDPVAFAEAHLAALAAAHGHVADRAARAVALAGAEAALAGQVAGAGEGSLLRLGAARWRALAAAARSARTPAEDRALAVLAVLTRKLREAHDEIARVGRPAPTLPRTSAPPLPAAERGASAGGEVAFLTAASPVVWDEVEADLAE